MYGLLIENITQYIQERYGQDKWNEIRRLAKIEETTFNTHTIYPDVYTKNIIDKACQVLKLTDKQLLIEIGESFVLFIGRYGYDIILSALGREFRDFLNSLDDLHEYLRLSYPRLRPPSYFCENENENGLILHYRTKRNFLLWYTVGQITKVGRVFYDTSVDVDLLEENQAINEYHFILQLRFDNRAFLQRPASGGVNQLIVDHHGNASTAAEAAQAATQLRLSRLFSVASAANGGRCPFSGAPIPPTSSKGSNFDFCTNGSPSAGSACASPSPEPESVASLASSSAATNASSSLTLTTSEHGGGVNGLGGGGGSLCSSLSSAISIHKMAPIPADVFLEIFPFSIIYDSSMRIRQTGNCLQVVCPNIINQSLTQTFALIKPKIEFTWDSIMRHTNTTFEIRLAILLKNQNKSRRILFELRNNCDLRSSFGSPNRLDRTESVVSYNGLDDPYSSSCNSSSEPPGEDNLSLFLQLKGQMMYFPSWKCIAFLGAPNVTSLDTLIKTGLYLNDLSMHDFSRDMVLACQQQSAELKLALDQELHKSRQLEITIKKLDEERRRSDELLYQMKIADKLRIGEKNIETCQYFHSVTILFSDIVQFTEICSKIAPMQVVSMLNDTYTKFDQLTEKHDIYKVETIGDAYLVAGGLPVHQEESSHCHARKVCLMAMDMIEAVHHIKDPSRGRHLKIRIGIHTGPVVGGIVGQKMPRYCLFGDTVNTSSRMETSSLKMRVQISENTQRLLDNNEWDIRERGTIRLKGKGMVKTYWLNYRKTAVGNNSKSASSSSSGGSSRGSQRRSNNNNNSTLDASELMAVETRQRLRQQQQLQRQRSNGTPGNNRVRPLGSDELEGVEEEDEDILDGEGGEGEATNTTHPMGPRAGKRFSFGGLSNTTHGRSNSDSMNDSNYSLFVRDRFKRPCAIL